MNLDKSVLINTDMNYFPRVFNWIKYTMTDAKYNVIYEKLILDVYRNLNSDEQLILTNYLVRLINFIKRKFCFDTDDRENLFWQQLIQNNYVDLRALLNMILPFVIDDTDDSKKNKLKSLNDLYLTYENGRYVYTNMQYNRCVRVKTTDSDSIKIIKRPFHIDYFYHHFELLLMSIETSANKLYVNWMDILPFRMDTYKETDLYKQTIKKIQSKENGFLLGYIDLFPGLPYGDIYNVMSNQLFHQISQQKWLIFDLNIRGKTNTLLSYLEEVITFSPIWDKKTWSILTDFEKNNFASEWKKFKSKTDRLDMRIFFYIGYNFEKQYSARKELIKQGLFVPFVRENEPGEDYEYRVFTDVDFVNAKVALEHVPMNDIYSFILDQINMFRKSWYYYITKVKENSEYPIKIGDPSIQLTPKNIYNYAKSICHYEDLTQIGDAAYPAFPKHWHSVPPKFANEFMKRLLVDIDYDDPSQTPWFNISRYVEKTYQTKSLKENRTINKLIYLEARKQIVDVIFESMIFHGLLSEFVPNKNVTDIKIIDDINGSADESKRKPIQRKQMKSLIYSSEAIKAYKTNSYYFLTGQTYGELRPVINKKFPLHKKYSKSFFDFLLEEQTWTFTYAMNWVSQLNFYHHYMHNRIIYITGATGVGKSTETPKLLFYCLYMMDYKIDGKVICTLPRSDPAVRVARYDSEQMGVAIEEFDPTTKEQIPTNDYYIQYKHKKADHIDRHIQSFLRFVTDGTLIAELKNSPFLTRSTVVKNLSDTELQPIEWVKTYESGNLYDIVIVDEAHEHNTNMDLILTLMRDATYVNNSLKLIIISATMEDDDPIYRRYFRKINDNRAYPVSSFIASNQLDRANMDRRIDISKPRETTQFKVEDVWLSKKESDLINEDNFVQYGIEKCLEVLKKTDKGHILLFMTGIKDIKRCQTELNKGTPYNVICFGYYGEAPQEIKDLVLDIKDRLPKYDISKTDETKKVQLGTYTRAIIVATNVAEASITIADLRYIIDTGYAKVNVYDPIERTTKLINLPISQTSSKQRRGRVGRDAPGVVYYLYDKEKVANIKTAYKIADENVRDNVVGLLKSESADYPIITEINDFNNLKKITELKDPRYQIPNILLNVDVCQDIIKNQYMFVNNIKKPRMFYTWYGKGDILKRELYEYKNIEYFSSNHDDYEYQAEEEFISRCHTGYDRLKLVDKAPDLDFYIIHPDENIIRRNPYTGRMIGLKYTKSISDAYWYLVLSLNHLLTKENVDVKSIDITNFNNFYLYKIPSAFDDAQNLSLILVADLHILAQPSILLSNNKSDDMKYYFKYINDLYSSGSTTLTIKTSTMMKIEEFSSIMIGRVDALADKKSILWYIYARSYGLELDVLGMCCLLNTGDDLTAWVEKGNDLAKLFLLRGKNNRGDIYFFWKLWTQIKIELDKLNILPKMTISDQTLNYFKMIKNKFANHISISSYDKVLLDKLVRSGSLYTKDEFYYYVKLLAEDIKQIPVKYGNVIAIVVKKIKFMISELNVQTLYNFLVVLFYAIIESNRYIWLYQYEILNGMNEESETEIDVVTELKDKLLFPRLLMDATDETDDKWNIILETYLRATSNQLVKNIGSGYLSVDTATVIDMSPWSKAIKDENTLLNSKTTYLIYDHMKSGSDRTNVFYLTPVKLEWIVNLNPLYYYYALINNLREIQSQKIGPMYPEIIKSYQEIQEVYSVNSLINYMTRLNDRVLSKVIMHAKENIQDILIKKIEL